MELAYHRPCPIGSQQFVVLQPEVSIPGLRTVAICVLKDSHVLDKGNIPCVLHKAPKGSAVAMVSLLAAADTLVMALLISHAKHARQGRVVLRVVHEHTAGNEELAHSYEDATFLGPDG